MTAHLGSNIYFLFSEHGWENVTRLKEGEGERKVKEREKASFTEREALQYTTPTFLVDKANLTFQGRCFIFISSKKWTCLIHT